MAAKGQRDYQPLTFEQRGVHVPFRHKYLAFVRLRAAKGPEPRDWDAVIQNFSENRRGQNLVMGWRELPKFASLEAFDQALYDRVTALGAEQRIGPAAVRAAHLETVRTYGSGEMERVTAGALLDRDSTERAEVFIKLLARLVRECGMKAGFPAPDEATLASQFSRQFDREGRFRSPPGRHEFFDWVANDLMAAAGISRETLIARVDATANALAPVAGVMAEPIDWSDGYLLKSYCRLREFRGHMSEIAKDGGPYYFNGAVIVLFAVVESTKYIDRRLSCIRQRLNDTDTFLLSYKEWEDYFSRMHRDFSYALDGWAILVGLWERTVEGIDPDTGFLAIRDALTRILHWLPILPTQEVEGSEQERRIWDQYDSLRSDAVQELSTCFEGDPNAGDGSV